MSERQDKIEHAIAARIGHNLPSEEQTIRDNMAEKYASYKPRVDELVKDGAGIPEVIPEDLIPMVTDFVAACTTHVKAVDTTRKSEKDKYTRAGQVVDGFFKRVIDPIDDGNGNGLKWRIQKRLKAALDAKADRERRIKEEEARRELEAAQQRQRESAERLRQEQERAAQAKAAADAAERLRVEEEAKLRAAIAADNERKRLAEEAAERSRRAAEDLASVDAPAPDHPHSEAPSTVEPAGHIIPAPPAPAVMTLAERIEQNERERVAGLQAREKQGVAERAERDLQEATRDAERTTSRATAAVQSHAKVTTAKSAEFARTRGDYGKVATLQDFWNHGPIDRKALFNHVPSLRQIWRHIPDEAIEAAVKAHIAAAGKNDPTPITGVSFFKDTRGQVR